MGLVVLVLNRNMKKLIYLYVIFNLLILSFIIFIIKYNKVINLNYQETEVYYIGGSTLDLEVMVISTQDTTWCRDYIKHNYDIIVETGAFNSRGFTIPTENGMPIVIWLENLDDTAVLNHELLHATISIMQWANIPLTPDTEEIYCYQLQYFTNELKNKRGTF